MYHIGIPWGTEAYVCPGCKEANFRVWPYCPNCGSKQDPRKVFKPRAARPGISKPEEMRETLSKLLGHRVRLWDYLISHSVLQLRVAHFATYGYSSKQNTLIVCTETQEIRVPTRAWDSGLRLGVSEDKYGKLHQLIDDAADVLIECRHLIIYEKMPANFFGV
jgi:hypothetical protein